MKLRHRDNYSRLLGEWTATVTTWYFVRFSGRRIWTESILGHIESFEREFNVGVRPDGRLLLVVNFEFLIAQPLQMDMTAGADSDLAEIVRHDVWAILQAARDQDRVPDDRQDSTEISAHDIVDALSRSWSKLRSSEQRLWD